MHHLFYNKYLLFIIGQYCIALGASVAILANIGVTPVTALPYALSLITPISVGVMSIFTNLMYIGLQLAITREFLPAQFTVQFLSTFLFGLLLDVNVWLTHFLPIASSIGYIVVYFALSLLLMSFGITCTVLCKLPPMPYDALTNVIRLKRRITFGRAKMLCDLLNVALALTICLVALRAFGSIGIGTFIAIYGLGKLINVYMHWLQPKAIHA